MVNFEDVKVAASDSEAHAVEHVEAEERSEPNIRYSIVRLTLV